MVFFAGVIKLKIALCFVNTSPDIPVDFVGLYFKGEEFFRLKSNW